MNIAFFLTPKSQVTWLPVTATMKQAIAQMQTSGYTAVPLLDDEGRYLGTLSEGDLLRKLTEAPALTLQDVESTLLDEVSRRMNVRPVGIDAQMEELFLRAIAQNFVPVVDSRGVFIGIVTRRAIIEYYSSRASAPQSEPR